LSTEVGARLPVNSGRQIHLDASTLDLWLWLLRLRLLRLWLLRLWLLRLWLLRLWLLRLWLLRLWLNGSLETLLLGSQERQPPLRLLC
jgi:hypothetical protein